MKSFQLKLNSYKTDTTPIQKQLSHLKQLNSQFQTTIFNKQTQNQQLKIQIQRLKHENDMLRMKIQQLKNQKDNKAILIKEQNKIEELSDIIIKLQKNLETTLNNANQNLILYNRQLQQNQKYKQRYQQQELWLKEEVQYLREENQKLKESKNSIKNNKQIYKLSNVYQTNRSQQNSSLTHNVHITHQQVQPPYYQLNLALEKSKNKQGVSKCKTSPFSQDLTVEEVYMKLMRKLFQSIKQKGFSAKQITALPQVKTLKNLNTVSQNNFAKFLGSYPFQINDLDQIHRSYKSMHDQLIRKYKDVSGANVFQLIFDKLQLCQINDLINSDMELGENQTHYNYPQRTERTQRTQRTTPVTSNQHDTSVLMKKKNSYRSHLNMKNNDQKQNLNPLKLNYQKQSISQEYKQKSSQSSLKSVSQPRRVSQRSATMSNGSQLQSINSDQSSGYGGNFFTVQNYPDPINQTFYQKKYNGPDKRFNGQRHSMKKFEK